MERTSLGEALDKLNSDVASQSVAGLDALKTWLQAPGDPLGLHPLAPSTTAPPTAGPCEPGESRWWPPSLACCAAGAWRLWQTSAGCPGTWRFLSFQQSSALFMMIVRMYVKIYQYPIRYPSIRCQFCSWYGGNHGEDITSTFPLGLVSLTRWPQRHLQSGRSSSAPTSATAFVASPQTSTESCTQWEDGATP